MLALIGKIVGVRRQGPNNNSDTESRSLALAFMLSGVCDHIDKYVKDDDW